MNSQLKRANVKDHLKDGDMIKSATFVFHLDMVDAKAIKIISQRKVPATIIVRSLVSARVSIIIILLN